MKRTVQGTVIQRCASVSLRTFPLNVFQSVLPETFWRSKQTFELSGPDNEINQS